MYKTNNPPHHCGGCKKYGTVSKKAVAPLQQPLLKRGGWAFGILSYAVWC